MNIGIIGYGKMGKTIEALAVEKGHRIAATFTSAAPPTASDLQGLDVCIEFSTPQTAMKNILTCFEAGVPVVVGTTAWYNELETMRSELKRSNGSIFYASNFSLGVHLFWQANRFLAKLMGEHQEYLSSIHEIHHIEKKDAPSGTAITTAEEMIKYHPKLENWNENSDPKLGSINISHDRLEDVKGTHIVSYTSDIDTIKLEHSAKSRNGFALGAIKAAEFMQNKTGEYTMADLLNFPQL